ncbi:MAG: cupin domain-containing protein [Bryobacterales bacterium]|nr:cupin domain-containing protein [Bryobacterales bacterium]
MTPDPNLVRNEAAGGFTPPFPADNSSARVHLSGSTPANAFSIVEFSSMPGNEPPTSVHASEDRFFCLLEGEWDVRVGDERFRVKAGGSFFAPRGVAHEYRILSPLGRAVVLITAGSRHQG